MPERKRFFFIDVFPNAFPMFCKLSGEEKEENVGGGDWISWRLVGGGWAGERGGSNS